jgi:hypothetical protein
MCRSEGYLIYEHGILLGFITLWVSGGAPSRYGLLWRQKRRFKKPTNPDRWREE